MLDRHVLLGLAPLAVSEVSPLTSATQAEKTAHSTGQRGAEQGLIVEASLSDVACRLVQVRNTSAFVHAVGAVHNILDRVVKHRLANARNPVRTTPLPLLLLVGGARA